MNEKPKDDKDITINMLSSVLAILFLPGAFLLKALVLHLLWGWFVAPAFSVPSPGILMLGGLMVLVACVRGGTVDMKDRSPLWHIAQSIVGSALSCGIGWLIHLCI